MTESELFLLSAIVVFMGVSVFCGIWMTLSLIKERRPARELLVVWFECGKLFSGLGFTLGILYWVFNTT